MPTDNSLHYMDEGGLDTNLTAKVKIKIPRESWFLCSVGHAGGSKTIKKPRFYTHKGHAIGAVSHIHYKVGETGLKIYKEIDENIYFIVMYVNFWENRAVTPIPAVSYRRDPPIVYCYVAFKNPTDISEIEVDAKLPELKFEIISAKLSHCLSLKDASISYGAPMHESEGDPVFIMDLKFKPNMDGWKYSISTMPMYWHNDDGYNLATIKQRFGGMAIRNSSLFRINPESGDYDESFKLHAPSCKIPVSEEEEKKILDAISDGV